MKQSWPPARESSPGETDPSQPRREAVPRFSTVHRGHGHRLAARRPHGPEQPRHVVPLPARHEDDARGDRQPAGPVRDRAEEAAGVGAAAARDQRRAHERADAVRELGARRARLLLERAPRPSRARPPRRRPPRLDQPLLQQERPRSLDPGLHRQERPEHGLDDRPLQRRSALRAGLPGQREQQRRRLRLRHQRRLPSFDLEVRRMIWREKRIPLAILGVFLLANAVFFFTYRVQYENRLSALEADKHAAEQHLEQLRARRAQTEQQIAAYRKAQADLATIYNERWATLPERFTALINEVKRLETASQLIGRSHS